MKPGFRVVATALSLTLLPLAVTADPVVTDPSVITNERRVAILEWKLASLRQQVALRKSLSGVVSVDRYCSYK